MIFLNLKTNMNTNNLGKARQDAHPKGTKRYYKDVNREDTIGIAGEIAFGNRYNLTPDLEIRPMGDGHVDFKINVEDKKIITIDVKTAQKAYNLLIKKWEIDKASDILVLAHYIDNDNIEFLGWSTRKIMKQQPIKVFSSLGIENYFLSKDKLNSMEMLDELFTKASIQQILDK